jgi:RNA polymerase sigma-70 factor (ECF subfamily)
MVQIAPMAKTDKNLIDAHIMGDKTAFAEILCRHGPAVLGYLTKMANNREQAEDFFQDTFKRVHEKAHTLRSENFKPWLYTIATNIALNAHRKNKKRTTLSLNQKYECQNGNCGELANTVVAQNAVSPSKQAIKEEQRTQVVTAINTLPGKQKTTLILAYYQQLSYREVAKILDCTVGTVKTQMFRALKSLAQKLPDASGVIE